MDITLEDIKYAFGNSLYESGMQDYQNGKIHNLTIREGNGLTTIRCELWGNNLYQVRIQETPAGFANMKCSCGSSYYGYCRHMAAAAIAYVRQNTPQKPKPEAAATDRAMRKILESYLRNSQEEETPAVPATLIPCLNFPDEGYPYLSVKVSKGRPYVVRSISEFLSYMQQGATVAYGKLLSLTHTPSQFDPTSQKLIELMQAAQDSKSTDYRYYAAKDQLQLNGETFARLFDLYQGTALDAKPEPLLLKAADPSVSISIRKSNDSAVVAIDGAQTLRFFGDTFRLYARDGSAIYRCSPAFRKKVYPLLEQSLPKSTYGLDQPKPLRMKLALNDVPAFCACVLPQIQELVPVNDPSHLLENYRPEECTPCLYLDWEEDRLTLSLKFRYGEKEIPWDASRDQWKDVRRDLPAEQRVKTFLQRTFQQSDGTYFLPAGDPSYTFLAEQLPALRELGEVYVSDRLKSKQFRAAPPSVGISVSDGMLTLTLDTGGFPAEELAELYQSLLKKKKYYQLKDGRFLTLDGSGTEKMAEMAQMLQLGKRDLQKDAISLPAFRALYLDSLLSGSEDIQVTRDRSFRQMIRDFKAVEESDYNLPGGLETALRSYQKTGFRWLKTLESCGFGGILADEMGLGKTPQTIAYLATVPYAETKLPSLVVCPTSLIYNWGDELKRFAPQLNAALILGPAAERKRLRAENPEADLWVTSYELLRQDIEDFAQREFYCCVLDEGQHIKNQTTLISKAVKRVDCRQRFVLTGTPIENRLSELWNLFDFLMPGYLFTQSAFREKLEKPIVKSGNPEAQEQLRKLVTPFILRRLKKDVLKELPPKIEHVQRIQLSETEQKTYYSAVHALQSSLGEGDGKLKILAALTQLRQICCDPGLCFENYEGQTSKLDACLELCESMVENGHQILLFSQFTSMLEILRRALDAKGISNFTLQGSTSKEQRTKLVREFNEGKASVFLISLKAGGTGLNLTAADVVIHYDPWWNLAAQEQATDRAHRIGQQAHVQVYKLIAKDTIEESILDLQEKKAALMETLSGNTEAGILEMSKEELLELLKIGQA